jgi:hypothetical protein
VNSCFSVAWRIVTRKFPAGRETDAGAASPTCAAALAPL